jgi:MurNAc alpha-1-phosphate uridylyltransferase
LREALSNSERIRHYSHEGRDFGGALETAGGIVRALPQLDDVFWVLAGDVFAPDFMFTQDAMAALCRQRQAGPHLAGAQPAAQPEGRLWPGAERLALNQADAALHLFHHRPVPARAVCGAVLRHSARQPGGVKAPLAPLLRAAMDNQQITAELYTGPWTDVGTPERLAQLNTP